VIETVGLCAADLRQAALSAAAVTHMFPVSGIDIP
jgi:hypothetical protein